MEGLTWRLVVRESVWALNAIFAMVGAGAVLFALLTWRLGYTWIGMPPEGGCWP